MAVVTKQYSSFRKNINTDVIDFDTNIYCALVNSTYAVDVAALDLTDTIWADVSANEVSGTGYTAGGKNLTTVVVSNSVTQGIVSADDLAWSTLTATMRWAILYRSGTYSTVTDPLIAAILLNDTPADVGVTAVDFTLRWSGGNILLLNEA